VNDNNGLKDSVNPKLSCLEKKRCPICTTLDVSHSIPPIGINYGGTDGELRGCINDTPRTCVTGEAQEGGSQTHQHSRKLRESRSSVHSMTWQEHAAAAACFHLIFRAQGSA
jgi:hypothetical protein